MTSRLRSILGGSNRVKKKPSNLRRSSGGENQNHNRRASRSSSSWSDSLPRTKSGASTPSTLKHSQNAQESEAEHDFFNKDEPLPDAGLVMALAADLTLRDVPQAMRYAQRHMFTPMPEQPSSYGLNSTRTTEVLNFRRNMPRLTTTAHLHALLRSPTAVERETAELVRAGMVRKVVILRRGGGSRAGGGGGVLEFLVEGAELEGLVSASGSLKKGTKSAFGEWLRENPAKLKVASEDIDGGRAGQGTLKPEQVDELVRGGFLTTYHDFDIGHVSTGFARPEDQGTMLSLEAVSRAAAGSYGAVGGQGAIHSAGGSGGARSGGTESQHGGGSDLSLAVPGQGTYFKLTTAALTHLAGLLSKSTHKEMPERLLRERWDGGIANGSLQHAGKRGRREFSGVLPARTKKWKEFHGLSFEWILHEAIGAGLVELFETGSVGRAVRLL